jgi:hypothetical protein
MSEPTPDGVSWLAMSPADYDARLTARGHKRAAEEQPGLFYVPTPTRETAAPRRQELDGQAALFGGDA